MNPYYSPAIAGADANIGACGGNRGSVGCGNPAPYDPRYYPNVRGAMVHVGRNADGTAATFMEKVEDFGNEKGLFGIENKVTLGVATGLAVVYVIGTMQKWW